LHSGDPLRFRDCAGGRRGADGPAQYRERAAKLLAAAPRDFKALEGLGPASSTGGAPCSRLKPTFLAVTGVEGVPLDRRPQQWRDNTMLYRPNGGTATTPPRFPASAFAEPENRPTRRKQRSRKKNRSSRRHRNDRGQLRSVVRAFTAARLDRVLHETRRSPSCARARISRLSTTPFQGRRQTHSR
jgi:hypothetical protein